LKINKKLKIYFDNLDENEPIDELKVGQKIKEILETKGKKISNKYDIAEYIAFQFLPNYQNKSGNWGTYYGPMFVLPNDKAQYVEFPSIQQIDTETLKYWAERAKEAKHPSLVCRYADLIVDFGPKLNKGSLDYAMAQKVIDSTVEICAHALDDGLGCKEKLKRAFTLAKSINDSVRIKQIQQSIISTENQFAEDSKPGLWGYAFSWLILDAKKYQLGDKQKKQLVEELEERLLRLSNTKNPSPWNVECAVNLLAKYYVAEKNEAKLKTALGKLEKAFRKDTYSNSDGLLIVNYLEKLFDIYNQHAQFDFAKKASQRIKTEMSNLGDRGKFGTQEVSVEMDVKKKDIDRFLDSLFGKDRRETTEKIIIHLAVNFIPRKDQVETQLRDSAKKYVFLSLGNQSVMSEDGFSIARFGSINEDFDKHLLQHFSQNMQFQAMFLSFAFAELKKHQSPEALYEVFVKSPVFRSEDKNYISKILKSFWEEDYLTSNCLMIPLIEDAIRNVYRINHLSFIRKNSDFGYDVESLNILLERGVIKGVFGKIGDDVEYYFRVLLTERIGWNLRNNFAHGVNKNAFAQESVANRLLHVLFCLSLIRKNPKKKESPVK